MAFLGDTVDRPGALKKLWEERSSSAEFKMRDSAYKIQERTYLSRTPDGQRANVTWRPIMLDGEWTSDGEHKEALNLAKQIGLHHQSSFARAPRVWNTAPSVELDALAQRNTGLIGQVLRASRVKLVQGGQAHYLAVRGDACYGIGYDQRAKERPIWVKGVDPNRCYPAVDEEQPGRLWDNLITFEVRKSWAEKQYGLDLGQSKATVRVFEYWDDEWRLIQVEEQRAVKHTLHHSLGFLPWCWCYNQIPNRMAQADISETPKIQEYLNDLLVLALDATRRNIDIAYYATGHQGVVEPRPGKVIGFPNPNVRIDQFPTSVPPAMLMQVMSNLQSFAESMAGISPISMEGMAEGSIVTGSAVRHQVEAIEARMETKRSSLEAVYGWVGESILRTYRAKFPDLEMQLRINDQDVKHSGSQVGEWYQCEAAYGSFDGLPAAERGNWAMQGEGRVHGRRTAIQLAYPDRDVGELEREIDDYQVHQAVLSAKAQQAAQAVMQSGGAGQGGGSLGVAAPGGGPGVQPGGAPPAPSPPQVPGRPPQPGMAMLGQTTTISDLKLLLQLVQGQVSGDVYAVGEIAITGMTMMPDVAVTRESDQALVAGAMQARRARVRAGVQDDEPKVLISG